jgi:amphiphysin
MQNVQRKFGKLKKRSADRSDVGTILSEFNTADLALGSVREYYACKCLYKN